jgi:hypothetical protein
MRAVVGFPPNAPPTPFASACRAMPAILRILYAVELNHAPGESGVLEFSRPTSTWLNAHRDERLQRQAECFLAAYLSRHPTRC